MNERFQQSKRNRREASRFPMLHSTRYQVSQEGMRVNTMKGQAFIINISDGGVCFFLDRPLDKATIIEFNLPAENKKDKTWKLAEIKWAQSVSWAGGCFVGSVFVN